jgi:hypothetical protein
LVLPHYTIPVNIRPRDAPTIEAAKEIAQRENKQMTAIFRQALEEFVARRKMGEMSVKLEQYFGSECVPTNITLEKVLLPSELKNWTDKDLLSLSKKVRARSQELDRELRRRGFLLFRW